MDQDFPEHHYIGFFTASILGWKSLLRPNKYKQLVIESLEFLVTRQRIKLYAFVIMPNHIHILWKIEAPHQLKDVQRDFLKFTGQQICFDLKKNHPKVLAFFEVNAPDRKYQFWQKQARNILHESREIIEQKLDYIHNNPCQGQWMLASDPITYEYSSASFYETGNDSFGFLSHYKEVI